MEGQRDDVAASAPPPVRDRRRALLADAALLSVAIVWGLNFVVIKDAIADTGPMTYLLWRHILAAIMLAAVMPRTVRQTRRRDWLYGAVLGLFLFIAFVTRGPGATNASIGLHTGFQDSRKRHQRGTGEM